MRVGLQGKINIFKKSSDKCLPLRVGGPRSWLRASEPRVLIQRPVCHLRDKHRITENWDTHAQEFDVTFDMMVHEL